MLHLPSNVTYGNLVCEPIKISSVQKNGGEISDGNMRRANARNLSSVNLGFLVDRGTTRTRGWWKGHTKTTLDGVETYAN
jgi:hypothetical protein